MSAANIEGHIQMSNIVPSYKISIALLINPIRNRHYSESIINGLFFKLFRFDIIKILVTSIMYNDVLGSQTNNFSFI